MHERTTNATEIAETEDGLPLAVWLAAIALLGLILRAWMPNVVQFGIDEAIASSLATQIAHGHHFPLAGIRTSFGFLNPPTYLYMLAPFFAITRDPALVALLPMTLGALAAVFAGLAGASLGGRRVALLACLLVSLSPNAIEHSRRLWGHDLVVFFAAVACWGSVVAYRLARAEAPRAWWPLLMAGIAASLAQSIHLSGVLLWLPVLVIGAGTPRRLWPGVMGGIGVMVCLYVPWLLHDARQGWGDLRTILGTIQGGETGRDLGHPVSPLVAWSFILGDSWNNDLLGGRGLWTLIPVAGPALTLFSGSLLLFAIYTGLRGLRPLRLDLVALGALLFGTPLLFGILFRAVVPPYLLPALVPAALLAAVGLNRLADGGPRRAAMVGILVGGQALASLAAVVQLRVALALGEGSTPSLAEKKAIVRSLGAHSEGRSFRLMQNSRHPATGIDVAYIYLFHWRGIGSYHKTQDPEHLFVVTRQDGQELHPSAREFLAPFIIGHTDNLVLHEVPISLYTTWLELVVVLTTDRIGKAELGKA